MAVARPDEKETAKPISAWDIVEKLDEEIARQIDAGQVRPVVGAESPLADAIRAYQTKPLRGKVVLRVDGDG